jgi:hypothetical protein
MTLHFLPVDAAVIAAEERRNQFLATYRAAYERGSARRWPLDHRASTALPSQSAGGAT